MISQSICPLCVSSQPLCSSEHPTKTPGPIGLSPPSSEGRSGLVHPGTDDRQAASSTEYYYTSRSYTYEQKQQERALTYMEMRSIMNRNATTSTTTNMRSILDAIRGDVPLFAPGRQLAKVSTPPADRWFERTGRRPGFNQGQHLSLIHI